MECQHIDYDDYFDKCNDCGAKDLLPESSACCDAPIDDFGYCTDCKEHAK